jgi:YHS domain-containing protein
MSDVKSLASRIDAEFTAAEDKIKKFQTGQVEEYKQRQKRVEQLGKVFDKLVDICRPRLELLVKSFGDRVNVTPRTVPSTREATFGFQSGLARVQLRFSATTDRDVRKVVLGYHLEIIPVLMRYKQHDEAEFPLEAVDYDVAGKWVDDRIVEFVRTYFALGENEVYLKDEMVEDPVAHVRFPKTAAATKMEWNGQQFYFIGEETRRDFEKQHAIGAK